jgi:hypothetical protein
MILSFDIGPNALAVDVSCSDSNLTLRSLHKEQEPPAPFGKGDWGARSGASARESYKVLFII